MYDPAIARDVLALITERPEAFFSTLDEHGAPETRAMLNLRCIERYPSLTPLFQGHEHDFLLYFTTNTSSRKMAQVQRRPDVAVYFHRPDTFFGALFTGRVAEVHEPELKRAIWQPGWEMYYPLGPDDPDYAIVRLLPEQVRGWYHGRPYAWRPDGLE